MSKRVSFGSTMETKNYNELKRLSDELKVPISKLLDAAVEALFETLKQSRGIQRTPQKQPNLRIEEANEPYRINIGLPDSDNDNDN